MTTLVIQRVGGGYAPARLARHVPNRRRSAPPRRPASVSVT